MEPQPVQIVFDAAEIRHMLRAMAADIAGRNPDIASLALVGIRTGGAHLSARLRDEMLALTGERPLLGVIDITLYRDDWTLLHTRPKVGKTEIEFPMDQRRVVLVDDVLFTGRTVRAGLDALIDFGRPRSIELAVLIDRGRRELPIQPDYVGAVLAAGRDQVIDVLLGEEGAGPDRVVKRPA
jgi:pyrimidine operon attenuation protein/uracil phosphoribosyltransferase